MSLINKDILKDLRVDINEALASVAKKHNMSLRAGNATYDPTLGTAHFKLEVVAHGDNDKPRDLPAEEFKRAAVLIGLRPEDLHAEIMLDGRKFTVAGYKPKARKNCIIIKDAMNGKNFVTSVDTIKHKLGR